MVDLATMRRIYRKEKYSDEQLLKIRDFLYNLAEIELKLREQ